MTIAYTDKTVAPGQTHTYNVDARDSAGASAQSAPATIDIPPSGGGGGPIDTVVWISIENGALTAFTPALAPYLNSLMATWCSCLDFTPGPQGTGNSLPNYMNAIVGAPIWGGDCDACQTGDTSIIDLLEAKGLTWKVYAESLAATQPPNDLLVPFPSTAAGLYDNHHVGEAHLTRVNSPGNPRLKNIQDASAINFKALPHFTHYVPNVLNIGHTPGGSAGIKNIDAFLKRFVPQVMGAPQFAPGGTGFGFIMLDNNGKNAAGQWNPIPWVAFGPGAKTGGFKSSVAYNPFSVLATIEHIFGLPTLGRGDATAKVMSDLLV